MVYFVLQYERTSLYMINIVEPILQSYTVMLMICGWDFHLIDLGSESKRYLLVRCYRKEPNYLPVITKSYLLLKPNSHGLFTLLLLFLKSSNVLAVGITEKLSLLFFYNMSTSNCVSFWWEVIVCYHFTLLQYRVTRGPWCWTLCTCSAISEGYRQRIAQWGIVTVINLSSFNGKVAGTPIYYELVSCC